MEREALRRIKDTDEKEINNERKITNITLLSLV
jgi:hypothetical protein